MSNTSYKEINCDADVRIYITTRGVPIMVELDEDYVKLRDLNGVPINIIPDNAAGYILAEDVKTNLDYTIEYETLYDIKAIKKEREKKFMKFTLLEPVNTIIKNILEDKESEVCPVYWIVEEPPECDKCIHCLVCCNMFEGIQVGKQQKEVDGNVIDTITDPASGITYPINGEPSNVLLLAGGEHEDG